MRTSLILGSLVFSSLAFAAAPCPHPYFPLDEKLQLVYRAGKGQLDLTFSDVARVDGGVTGTIKVAISGREGAAGAVCSSEGVKTEMGGLEGVALKAAGLDAKVLESTGVAMPPPGELVPGKKWSNTVTIQLTPKGAGMGGFNPTITSTLQKEAEVVGIEQLSLMGKQVSALKVKNRLTATAGRQGTMPRATESELWFVEGLGLVKLQTGKSVDLELVEVKDLPAPSSTQTKR